MPKKQCIKNGHPIFVISHNPDTKNSLICCKNPHPSTLDILTQYWFECGKPMGWLFPKQTDPYRPIDTFFLSRHIHEHENRLGWPRRITCHSFRHALGTHLYENDTDLLTIKAILGHKSILSTTIYVHLARTSFSDVVNPLDQMGGVCLCQSKTAVFLTSQMLR